MEEKRKLEILNRELEIENNILKQRCKQEREENRKRINELYRFKIDMSQED